MITPIIRSDMVLYPGMPVARAPNAKRKQQTAHAKQKIRAQSAMEISLRDSEGNERHEVVSRYRGRALSADNLTIAAAKQRRSSAARKTTLTSITEGSEMNFDNQAYEDVKNNNKQKEGTHKESLKKRILRHFGINHSNEDKNNQKSMERSHSTD